MNLPDEVTELTYYSDTCGGQNKNTHVAAMFFCALKARPNIKIINHKFMVSGHSHMEVDVSHSMIEKHKKRSGLPINHPHDWFQLVRSTGKKFIVLEMEQEHFFDFANLLSTSLVCRKKNVDKDDFKLKNIQWIQYRCEENGHLFYKNSLDEDEPFKKTSFIRRVCKDIELVPSVAYKTANPISKEKKQDLLELLPLIPSVFHPFYQQLQINKNVLNEEPDIGLHSEEEEET